MNASSNNKLSTYNNEVGIKFQLYNGLFTALPFHKIENTGVLLSQLVNDCVEGYRKGFSPTQIINDFLQRHTIEKTEKEKTELLFRFTQYAERQVVLFDALEDAAFSKINDTTGPGSIKQLLGEAQDEHKMQKLQKKMQDFCIQLVLTAHPTQFYTGAVLGIIHDTTKAVVSNNVLNINTYLQQLGKTPFLKKDKPTPYDEAISLIWFLENVFYNAAGQIISEIRQTFPETSENNALIKLGFWPGGDRDGNPFVTATTTLRVGDALRSAILRSYYLDVRKLRRRLTFKGVEPLVKELEMILYEAVFVPQSHKIISKEIILDMLEQMKAIIVQDHNGLFLSHVEELMSKVSLFGLHFASLDVRQDSSIHEQVLKTIGEKEEILQQDYATLNEDEKITWLQNISQPASTNLYTDIVKDTLVTIAGIKRIQQHNGEEGCNRYIISHSETAAHVLEVLALFRLAGWEDENIPVDIVPLFETVTDLENAAVVMKKLYENKIYANHLQHRDNKQTIMLGFSDGTKDGGYLMANWGIYKAKENLTSISAQYDIEVVFFDGRGGPPARGGGKTHKFYASMGKNIASKEIQLTVQGQTISSSFGTVASAKFNMEQLLSAGLANNLFSENTVTLNKAEEELMHSLAATSLEKYKALKENPGFMDYLLTNSPLKYYADTNIGSRPAKRNKGALTLNDLRAIPYVSAWSQMKQNVPGYYGVGTALEALEKAGKFEEMQQLYKRSLFVRTLFDNCEMSMEKSFFPLTAHLRHNEKFAALWQMIFEEYELTKKYVLQLSGNSILMETYPVDKQSISMREKIVLPLSTIQQYALGQMNSEESSLNEVFKKLVVRCSFGIINAARNSV